MISKYASVWSVTAFFRKSKKKGSGNFGPLPIIKLVQILYILVLVMMIGFKKCYF